MDANRALILLVFILSISFAWWDPSWSNRRVVFVVNPHDYQVNDTIVSVVIESDYFNFSKLNPDLSDVRFIWNDDVTMLNFSVKDYNLTAGFAEFYVVVPYLPPTSSAATYFYLYYGNPLASPVNVSLSLVTSDVGETGIINSPNLSTWYYVNFSRVFSEPPVVLASVKFSGTMPVVERIRNVTEYGFEVMVEPYAGYSGTQPDSVHWIALEPGQYYFGHINSTGKPDIVVSKANIGSSDTYIYYPTTLNPSYLVFADINSYNESDSGSHIRIIDKDNFGFYARIDEYDRYVSHVQELIGYIAIKGDGTFDSSDSVIYTGKKKVKTTFLANFGTTFPDIPVVIVDSNEELRSHTLTASMYSVSNSDVGLQIMESPYYTSSQNTKESVGYLATNASTVLAYSSAAEVSATVSYIEEEYSQPTPMYVKFLFILPSTPKTTDDLTCYASSSTSADNYTFTWYVNGVQTIVETTTNYYSTLSSSYTSKGDSIVCEAYFTSSGQDSYASNTSVTIVNSRPSQPNYLVPQSGMYGGTSDSINFTCSGSSDVDGDPLVYYFELLYDGYWHNYNSTDGNLLLNTSNLSSQINVDGQCYSYDGEDVSLKYNPSGTLSIDNDDPVTYSDYYNGTWSTTNVTVSLSCDDNMNPCDIYYCVATYLCTPNVTYSGGINLSEGIWYVGFTSYDAVGNKDLDAYVVVKIDTTKPSLTLFSPVDNDTYIGSVNIDYIASDNFGISRCWYTINNGTIEYDITDCQNTSYEGIGGDVNLTMYVKDLAGNIVSESRSFRFLSLINIISGGGGGGGSTVSDIDIRVKIPFIPPVSAELCTLDGCEKLEPHRGVAQTSLTVQEYRYAKVVLSYGPVEKEIRLVEDFGVTTNVFIDAGEELGLVGALYFQNETTTSGHMELGGISDKVILVAIAIPILVIATKALRRVSSP